MGTAQPAPLSVRANSWAQNTGHSGQSLRPPETGGLNEHRCTQSTCSIHMYNTHSMYVLHVQCTRIVAITHTWHVDRYICTWDIPLIIHRMCKKADFILKCILYEIMP